MNRPRFRKAIGCLNKLGNKAKVLAGGSEDLVSG